MTAISLFTFSVSDAQTEITLYNNFSGNVAFTQIGGSLRNRSNSNNPCSVTGTSSRTLVLPNGSTVIAAYLYWAGSYSTAGGSTRTTPDLTITFDGTSYTASRSFTATVVSGGTYPFFSGFADVTTKIQSRNNTGGGYSYSFSGLSVNTANPHCAAAAVVAGWAVVVIYTAPGITRHSINIYDGFDYFLNSSITFNPSNFFVPVTGKDGYLTHFTWEGDPDISSASEFLSFEGIHLSDANNPDGNQFNSVSTGLAAATTYGVDIDRYNVTSLLNAHDSSVTSVYSTGGDLVLLSSEIIAISDTNTADVGISKTHSPAGASIVAGTTETFTLAVTNNGPDTTGTITVTDSLPAGIRFQSFSGTGWTIDSTAKPLYKWTRPGPNPDSTSLPSINITTLITHEGYPTYLTKNKATISSSLFDRRPANNLSIDSFTVLTPIFATSTKTVTDINGSRWIPKDTVRYTIKARNTGNYTATNTSVVDSVPAGLNIVAGSITPGGSVSGQVITFNTATIAVGDSATYTFRAVIDTSAPIGVPLVNVAHIRNLTVDQAVIASFTAIKPVLFLRKTVTPASGNPGDTLTYTLRYGNIGTDTAKSISILDTIPSNTSYVTGSVSAGGTYDAPNNRITISKSFVAGVDTSNVVTFKVKVNTPLKIGANNIVNRASETASNASLARDSATSVITATSAISVTKSGPASVLLSGSPLQAAVTYKLIYSVTGNGIIDSVYLNDTLPSGMSFKSASNGGILVGSIIKWNLGTITPNKIDSVTLTDTTLTAGTYVNHARITWKTNPTGQLSNNTSTVVNLPHSGTLKQIIAIIPGQTVTDTVNDIDLTGRGKIIISLRNTRTSESETDTLSETGANTGIFTGTMATVFGTVSNGNNNGSFAVQAEDTIAGTYIDSVNSSGVLASVVANTRIYGGSTATIGVSPVNFAGGTSLMWTVNDTDLNHNAGVAESYSYTALSTTGETETISFTETGANSGIFTTLLATVSGTTPGINNNGVMTVNAGDTVTVAYRDTLTAIGNSANISARAFAGTVTLSASSKSVTDLNAGLAIPHDTLLYQIKAKNTGTVTATSVSIVDSLPTQITVVPGSITGGGILSGRVITFPTFNLNAGDSVIVSYRVTIDTNITDGSVKTNRAHILANGNDQLVTSSFTAYDRPVMSMVKAVDKSNAKPGDTLTYTVNYTNTGVATADSVTVTETTPLYTTYIHNTVILNGGVKTDIPDADEVIVIYDTPTVGRGSMSIKVGRVAAGTGGSFKYKVLVN